MPRKPTSNDNTTAAPQSNDQALQSAIASHDLATSAVGVIIEFETLLETIIELSTTRDKELIRKLASLGMDLATARMAMFDVEIRKHAKTAADCLKATNAGTNTSGGAHV